MLFPGGTLLMTGFASGDQGQILGRVINRPLFQGGADPHVHHDFFHARDLMNVLVLPLLNQGGPHFIDKFFVKS